MKRTLFDSSAQYVSTAQAADALGVSVTTVKRWVDDAILPAHRTAGGHRKLLLTDIVRLAREGNLPSANLGRLDRVLTQRHIDDPVPIVAQLIDALRNGQATVTRNIIHGAFEAGATIDWLADAVIAPALVQIGHEWENGSLDVMHEHRGTQLVAAALFELKAIIERHAVKDRPVAVGAAIEGDHYLLPTLLAQMSLTDSGWDAINLGPNTPFKSLEIAVDELRPKLIWVSVSFLKDDQFFESEYRSFYITAKAAGVAVAIGGHALTESTRSRLPYTTYGDGLSHLVAFAGTLHPRPKRPKRGRPFGS